MTNSPPLTIITVSDMVQDQLNTISNGLVDNGILPVAPIFGPASTERLAATGVANIAATVMGDIATVGDQIMPDTASGTYIDRWLNVLNIPRRAATGAIGSIIVSSSVSTDSYVPLHSQLLNPQTGLRYQTLAAGTYGTGDSIIVQAVDTGSDTNIAAGTVLTWVASPPYFYTTAVVSNIDPITNGIDEEDNATAQARLLQFFASTPGASSAGKLIQILESADPSVKVGFCYRAARGPSTVDMVAVGYQSTVSGSRKIEQSIINQTISPYFLGNLVVGINGYVTNSADYPIDIVIELSLPIPVNAGGPGGGFIDAQPFTSNMTGSSISAIKVVDGYALSGHYNGVPQNTASSFWISLDPITSSMMLPGNIYNISYVSPTTYELYSTTFTVDSSPISGHSFPPLQAQYPYIYYITIENPLYDNGTEIIQPGAFIFPTAQNTQAYVTALTTWVGAMGPGEKSWTSGSQALRYPRETISYPYKLDTRLLRAIENSDTNVYSSDYLFRGNGGTTTANMVDYGSLTVGSDPAYKLYAPPTTLNYSSTLLAPANIFVAHNIAFYPTITQ